jgi:hypothetical protein
MDFKSLFQQNKYVFIIMAFVFIGTAVYNIIRMRGMKSSNRNFIGEHPDIAKIYLTVKALITSEAVTVTAVDDEPPEYFTENGKTGFYAVPGNRVIEMSYTHNRPGIIYKNVTTTVGPVKKELIIAANKTYLLGFDRKEETFTFTEL